jgi:hypothetical protein
MLKKIIFFLVFTYFLINEIYGNNTSLVSLEDRVKHLEKKIVELELKIDKKNHNIKWKDLKRGLSKIKIQSSFGRPDRKGKFSNGDELWGFQNYTLKFDKNGTLKNWSMPFAN